MSLNEEQAIRDILIQQKKLAEEIRTLKSQSNELTETEATHLKSLQTEYKKLENQRSKANAARSRSFAEAVSSNQSLSGIYKNLSALESERINKSRISVGLTQQTQESLNNIASKNRELAQLTSGQVDLRNALQEEIQLELNSLPKMNGIHSHIKTNLEKQRSEAMMMSNLTEKQKEGAEQVLQIQKKLQGITNSVLETFQTLVSGPMGTLGTSLIGAGFLMKKLGHTAHETGTFFTEMSMSATGLSFIFGDAVNVAKSLSKELGGIENATFKTQLQANLLANNLHISSEEVSSLIGSFSRLNGNSTEVATSTIQATKNLAKANGVIPAQVMADLANSTEEFALYGKEGGTNIANAAVYAAKLGVSMSQLSGVANNLLDFESSITQELELGAMLGRRINLNKARQLAYDGKLGAATKETLNQLGGIDAFNKMDVFQKQQSAALLGVSVAEMQKMVANMDKLNDDGTIQLTQTEMIGKKFDYVAEIMKGIATGPGGDFLKMVGTAAIGAGQMGFNFKDMAVSIGKATKNLASKVWSKLGGTAGSSMADKLTDTVTGSGGGGIGSKQGMPGKGIMDGMSKINMNAVLKGAAAMVVVAGAVFVFGKAVQEFMKVSWESVGMAVVSMISLVGAVALLGAIMSSGVGAVAILAGAAAMVVVAGAMYILGKAIQEVATGFSALGMIGSTISELVTMIGGIGSLSVAFMGLAGSLMFLGTAGLVALPALLGISMASKGLAVVADILGIGGTTEPAGGIEEGSLSEYQTQMLQKMDKLIQATMTTRDVYLDREKVTNVVMRTGERKTENVFGLGVA